MLATVLLTQASMANYPGGEALRTFNHLVEDTDSRSENLTAVVSRAIAEVRQEVSVHIDNYAAQTGASLFLHERAPPTSLLVSRRNPWNVLYNKTENLVTLEDFDRFDWVITENPDRFMRGSGSPISVWKVRATVDGLRGFEMRSLGRKGVWTKLKIPRVVREAKLWILKQERSN